MAGIYFHIPFCRQACHYCDFHFSTSLHRKLPMLEAMQQELKLRQNFLGSAVVSTIYFGGGTPSILSVSELEALVNTVYRLFPVAADVELTLEANPDDLTLQKIKAYRHSPVNRLSIGIQSFFEEDLRWMNRSHNAAQAEAALTCARDAGFDNLTVDLIYGFPLLTTEKWQANLQKVFSFGVPHLSAYSMTVEAQTALAAFIRKGRQQPMSETQSARHFRLLSTLAVQSGYEHYEISNFALPGRHARHNSNYWNAVPYLGIGPSAHSFNGAHRQWNVSNNTRYIEALHRGILPAEHEHLTKINRLNEYIMTRLRTRWGLDLKWIEKEYGAIFSERLQKRLIPFLNDESIMNDHNQFVLTLKGKLFADAIAAALFETEETPTKEHNPLRS